MSSSSATATMAAAGFDKRSSMSTVSSLQTPGSGTFPSEMRSPMAGSPSFLKREESLRTPITPPSAYLDFLKSMSPACMSPMSTSTSSRFNFNEKSQERSSEPGSEKPSASPPTSQPALSRNTSYESAGSAASASSNECTVSQSSAGNTARASRPESPRITIPPSPFVKPGPRSSRTPRRLHIPQSPFSPAIGSAHTVPSPYSNTPLSAAPWSASFSPRDADPEANGKPGKMSVRQVVTRTVTYCRTPLEPAPRGKRRKLEAAEEVSSSSPPADHSFERPSLEKLSEEPIVKQEPAPEATTSDTSSPPSPPKDEPSA